MLRWSSSFLEDAYGCTVPSDTLRVVSSLGQIWIWESRISFKAINFETNYIYIDNRVDSCSVEYFKYWEQLFFSYENHFLNGDGQQFHQYQQNEQPLITSIYQAQKKVTTYGVWIQALAQLIQVYCNMKYLNALFILAFSENLWYAAVN